MTTWADIQRLAADLQRVQSSESAKKLSEMNCVEIISTLLETGKLDVVVTTNGKEYVTKKHLITEVQNECLAAGGRIALTELVPVLRVELDHVEHAAAVLAADRPDEFVMCAGELVSREHIDGLCKRINERLQECGQISMYQLSKHWDLPTDLLNSYVLTELGGRIDATRLEDQIYTNHFYRLQQNKLRAALVALTKPTVLQSIFASFDVPQSLFFNVWGELAERAQLNGHLIGTKGSLKSVYVPRMHDLLVRSYVRNAYLTNQYVGKPTVTETSTLRKLSIVDPQAYFRELLPKEKIADCVFLQSAVVSKDLWKQASANIEEKVTSDSFCVVESVLPPALSNLAAVDLETLVSSVKKGHSNWSVLQNDDESPIVFDSRLAEKALASLKSLLQERAQAEAPNVAERIKALRLQQVKKTDEKKAAADDDDDWGTGGGKKKGGKGGKKGGGGGAKSKTPAPSAQSSAQSDYAQVVSLEPSFVKDALKGVVDVPAALFDELADLVAQPASQLYRSLVEAQLNAVDTTDSRRSHEEKRQRVQALYEQICVSEAGLSELPESLANDLRAYLQRSLVADFCAHTLAAFVESPTEPTSLSAKQRDELIAGISDQAVRSALTELFAAQKADLAAFHDTVRALQSDCSFLVRQPDKRRRVEIVAEHVASLREKLEAPSTDHPTALLLIVLLLCTSRRPNPDSSFHASGKFVAPLIRFLVDREESPPPPEVLALLNDAQKLVVESVRSKQADGPLNAKLSSTMEQLKKHVLN